MARHEDLFYSSETSKAKWLAAMLSRGESTLEEIRALITIAPNDQAALLKAGLDVKRHVAYRARVLRIFERLIRAPRR
jgi:hypothetical protein